MIFQLLSLFMKMISQGIYYWYVPPQELWPNNKTWHWFERAALCGNVGASIKLAVALLYNEGGEIIWF